MSIQKYQNRIREFRKRQGMKQVELAIASGLSLATINRLEVWHFHPSDGSVQALASALNIEPDEIFPFLEKPISAKTARAKE